MLYGERLEIESFDERFFDSVMAVVIGSYEFCYVEFIDSWSLL